MGSHNRGSIDADGGAVDDGFRSERRKLLIAGGLLVPTIATLHATPAWAQTDYTVTAYRYGVNAGKCRNPNYNPNANPESAAGQEFIDCEKGTIHEDDPGEDQQDSGPIVF